MKTNTEFLMNALGWQGGTVHQVAQETGLSVMEILELHKYAPGDGDIRAISYHFTGKRRCEKGMPVLGYDWEGYDNAVQILGYYSTPLEAHRAWIKRKREIIAEVITKQDDQRLIDGLLLRLDMLDQSLENNQEITNL